jgi:hypothetical protein
MYVVREKPDALEKHISSIFRGSDCRPLLGDFLLVVLFDPKDGGNMFLNNVDTLRTTRHYKPEELTVHTHHSENFKYNTYEC